MGRLPLKQIHDVQVSECGVVIGRRGKPVSGADNGRGYRIVTVWIDGQKTCKGVHRLVAEAWVSNPKNLPEVNHKDGDKANNHASNLEWTTRGENIEHAYDNQLRSAEGESNARCKTTVQVVREICGLLQLGITPVTLKLAGYDYELVRAIKARRNWTHISKDYAW